ncbi:MAG: glycine cleavage T C-terminal barrel domain-containing protein [Geminicoccaceae bacterium]
MPLTLDEPGEADVPFCAPLHATGERVGLATSGFWSFTLGRSVALAYVRADLCEAGSKVEVELYGRRVAATVGREPLYDPENARLRS